MEDVRVIDRQAFDAAIDMVTQFYADQAWRATRELGFAGWEGSPFAPTTYVQLQQMSQSRKGLWMLVSDQHLEALYTSAACLAFRAWHDCWHLSFGLTFSSADELTLGGLQKDRWMTSAHRRPPGIAPEATRIADAILDSDCFGQTIFTALTGEFVPDQSAFGLDVIHMGLSPAVRKWVGGYTYMGE